MSRFDEMSGTMAHSSGPEFVSESADTSALGNMGGQSEAKCNSILSVTRVKV